MKSNKRRFEAHLQAGKSLTHTTNPLIPLLYHLAVVRNIDRERKKKTAERNIGALILRIGF